MKKTFKKLFAALLAAALVLAMAVPAFAVTNTGTNGSITIDNAVDGETYTIYRMFKLDSYNGDAYSYTVEPAWETFFSTGAGSSYIDLDSNGHPTWKTGADAAAFAKAALTWADNSSTIHDDGQGLASNKTVRFSNLPLGYYLVDSSLGALCSLDTTNPSATIKEKNDVPAMDKKIVTGENSTSDSSTAKIGDTVNYKVTIPVATGAQDYTLTDTMSDGLTFNSSSLKVTANGADATASSDYTLDSTEHGFKLVFKDSYIGNLAENAEITVTYSATLNEKAAVGDTGNGNTNSAALTYGNNKSVTHTTTTRTYEFDLLKVDGAQVAPAELELGPGQGQRVAAELVDGDLEGDPGPGGGLLEDQGDRAATQDVAGAPVGLVPVGPVQQGDQLVGVDVVDRQEVSFAHGRSPGAPPLASDLTRVARVVMSKGFSRTASGPSSLRSGAITSAAPVTTRTANGSEPSARRRRRMTSGPPSPGIITSSSTTSGSTVRASSRPSSPSAARMTSSASSSRMVWSSPRTLGSSSTTSTRLDGMWSLSGLPSWAGAGTAGAPSLPGRGDRGPRGAGRWW